MSFMKKFSSRNIIVFIAVILLCLLIFVNSCAQKNKKTTLNIWTALEQKELETLKEIASDFAKKKNINVVVTQIPMADFQLKYQVAAPAGFGADVITAPHDMVGNLSLAGLIAPLSKKDFPENLQKKFNPVAVKAVTSDSKIYGMPFSVEAIAIIYNKDMVPHKPQTMDELVSMAKKLTYGDQYGFLLQLDDTGNFYFSWPFFSGFGAYIFKNNNGALDINDIGLANKEAVEAANYLKYLRNIKIMPMSVRTDTSREFFNKGKAAFIINGPWSLSEIKKNKINYGIMGFPKLNNGKYPGPFVGVWALMLNPESKNKTIAVEFMRYFNLPENQIKIFNASGRIPTRTELYDVIKNNEDVRGFLESITHGVPTPNHPAMNTVWDHISRTIILIVDGKQDAEKALTDAVTFMKEDIKSMMQ